MNLEIRDDCLVVGPAQPQELGEHHLDHELEVARVHEEVAIEILEAAPERLVAAHVGVEAARVGESVSEAPDGGTNGGRIVRHARLAELRLLNDGEGLDDAGAAKGAAVDGAGVVESGAEQVAPEALGGIDGAEAAVTLGLYVLAHAEPPRA